MAATHILYESAGGYALFQSILHDEIGQSSLQVQESIKDLTRFSKQVKLVSFQPFADAAQALENANDISEGVLNDLLLSMLEQQLPSKKSTVTLGLSERGLAGAIKTALSIECDTSERVLELIRGIRLHAEKLLPGFNAGDVVASQLGLGHAYSRAKVKFNVNRSDNMIIQAIALLDQLDKDVNTFAMRVREWYGWHFPELVKIVPDNGQYARAVKLIGDKTKLQHFGPIASTASSDPEREAILTGLTEILEGDEQRATSVLEAAKTSMGTDISPIDLINISNFADRVINLFAYRKSLQVYLNEKMTLVAPNLGALIGDTVAARLISHAGSLTNLSKYPASTVQILGAEKALFRALKTKGNTPKYGLIYHSTFIGRAGQKNKGRISRFLANKCSIASRIDCYSDAPSTKFGEALRGQVEERLAFYETGAAPTKNATAMSKVLETIRAMEADIVIDEAASGSEDEEEEDEEARRKREKKEKKEKKKRKSSAMEIDEVAAEVREDGKKIKKKKSSKKLAGEDTPAVADTPSAPLSAAPPVDITEVDAKSAKKAKKEKKKRDSAAIADISLAESHVDPVEPSEPSEKKVKKSKKDKKAKA